MSAFSSFQHQHPLPLDSVFLPNSNSTCFSQFYQTETLDNIDQSTKVSALSNYQASLLSATNKNSMDSSSTVRHNYNNSEQLINYKSTPIRNKRNCRKVSANSAQSKDNSGVENKKQKKMKDSEEKKLKEEGPKGYIHVRARRGQATDSHSLAERVRREKISERMKLLQSIVPGCDKVKGKAPVLDQIINYVQSLQNQVEFLSMKIASLSPISYDLAMELETGMVSPDENSSSLSSPLVPAMQQRIPTTINDFLLLDDSINSLIYHEHTDQFPNALSEGNRVVCGEVDDQRQNIFNQSGLSDNLFHSI